MARKVRYPLWADWQTQIESGLSQAMRHTQLTGYRISGAATDKYVPVKKADDEMSTMPYVQAIFSGVEDGWDENMTGQLDYDSSEYTSIGDNKFVKTLNFVRERATWTVETFTQRYDQALAIAQTIKRYFNTMGNLDITWQGETLPVYTKLHNLTIEAAEADRAGQVEFWRASWLLTLSIISEQIDPDQIAKGIQEVVAETANSIGGDEEDTNTKVINNS